MRWGLFVGRFQPFHNGHLYIIEEALKEVDNLIVGICYSEKEDKKINPFSVGKRMTMINNTLFDEGIENCIINVIKDEIYDKDWVAQMDRFPKFGIVFVGDKNTTGEQWVEKCLKDKYKIKKIKSLEYVHGTNIRKRIKEGKELKHLVPKTVYKIIKEEI